MSAGARGTAVRTIRARATRLGFRLTVSGSTGSLYLGDELVFGAAPLDSVNAWLVERLTVERRPPGPMSTPVPPDWTLPLDRYRAELRAAHRTDQTMETRLSHLTTFARTIVTPPQCVTRDQLTAYIGRQGRGHRTAHGIRASLRDFFAFVKLQGFRDDDPTVDLPHIRQSRSRPRPCPDNAAYLALTETEDLRVRLAIRIMVETGIRRAEAAQLRPTDVVGDDGGHHALHVTGKSGDERIVPITKDLADVIRSAPGDYIFPSSAGGHLSPRHLGKVIAQALPGDWTAHTLRHRFATKAYAATRDIRAVQELLGHASPTTTAVYTAVSDQSMRAAAMAAVLTN